MGHQNSMSRQPSGCNWLKTGRSVSGDDELSWVAQTDFGYFGPPEEHFQWTQEEREATYITADDPSSEICGEVAAALAASSLALRDTGKPLPCPL